MVGGGSQNIKNNCRREIGGTGDTCLDGKRKILISLNALCVYKMLRFLSGNELSLCSPCNVVMYSLSSDRRRALML